MLGLGLGLGIGIGVGLRANYGRTGFRVRVRVTGSLGANKTI